VIGLSMGSIGMVIDHSGLVVRAPRWVALRYIELALIERADWVITTLAEWGGKNRDSLPTECRAGAALPVQPDGSILVELGPWEIRTIQLQPAPPS